jgi:hypothetical protein
VHSVGGEVIDQKDGYGPVKARSLDKELATKNADSYAYFASVGGLNNAHSHCMITSYIITGSLMVCDLFKKIFGPASKNRR